MTFLQWLRGADLRALDPLFHCMSICSCHHGEAVLLQALAVLVALRVMR